MGYGITKPLTVDSSKENLLSLLVAAGYDGPAYAPAAVTLLNTDGAVECYIHDTPSNSTAPATGTDGIPFGPASASTVWEIAKGKDLSGIWLYAASGITVKALV